MNGTPRIRDDSRNKVNELYPLNEIPEDVITGICGHIVYLLAVGRKDLTGNDFGDAFAEAIGGTHFASPLGVVDVGRGREGWSVKTVKATKPFSVETVRLISGRNSPDYSFGIEDPHADLQKTGDAVLKIWNKRVSVAYEKYRMVRSIVLVRNDDLTQFCLFEEEIRPFISTEYFWETNSRGNFEGKEKKSKETVFTWQPHGSQFTIHASVPSGAKKFELKQPKIVDKKQFLINLNYDNSWIHCLWKIGNNSND